MTPAPTRRQRERQRHRAEILAAARDLFAQQGFANTSMAQIAARAEFAVGTLYRLFAGKQALYDALIREAADEFSRALAAALTGPGDEADRLARYIDTLAELFVRHIPMTRLYFAQSAGAARAPMAGLDATSRNRFESLRGALEDLFRRGMRKRIFRKSDPALLCVGFEGLCNGFLHAVIEDPDAFPAERIAAGIKICFLHPVLRERE
jgi:TetR/AcrR family transcriptional regulator